VNKFIIGLTGTLSSGKGTVTDYLSEKGFKTHVFSDIIKDEINKTGQEVTRELLQNVGNALRQKHGHDVLAKRLVKKIEIENHNKVVVDGIRNTGELELLNNTFNCLIIGITASPNIRYKYIVERARTSDPISRKEFDRLEKRDRGHGEDVHGQQVDMCLELADHLIINEGTLEELFHSIETIISNQM
jgi:dephospho-CoA kinase